MMLILSLVHSLLSACSVDSPAIINGCGDPTYGSNYPLLHAHDCTRSLILLLSQTLSFYQKLSIRLSQIPDSFHHMLYHSSQIILEISLTDYLPLMCNNLPFNILLSQICVTNHHIIASLKVYIIMF